MVNGFLAMLQMQVDAIQQCGGQKSADGQRFRMGGGILWSNLKTREPKAHNKIMAKEREFEVQKHRCLFAL